jgi:hypothetical protein
MTSNRWFAPPGEYLQDVPAKGDSNGPASNENAGKKAEAEPEEHFSQRERPELGRYLLQVAGKPKAHTRRQNPLNRRDLRSKKNIQSFTSPSMTALTLPARCSRRPRQSEGPSNTRALSATRAGRHMAPGVRLWKMPSCFWASRGMSGTPQYTCESRFRNPSPRVRRIPCAPV